MKPIKRDVWPHATEATPAANVTLVVHPASMRRFQRRAQKVVTMLINAKPPKANCVHV
jgi:hypothetical protein